MLTNEQRDALRAAAEDAYEFRSPWAVRSHPELDRIVDASGYQVALVMYGATLSETSRCRATFIALANPATVTALINHLDAAEARVRELEAALVSAIRVADQAADEWDKAPSGMRAGKILLALAGHIPGYRADTDAIHAALKGARP